MAWNLRKEIHAQNMRNVKFQPYTAEYREEYIMKKKLL